MLPTSGLLLNPGPNLVFLELLQKESSIYFLEVLISHSSKESWGKSWVLKSLELALRYSKLGKYKLIRFPFTYIQALKYKVRR